MYLLHIHNVHNTLTFIGRYVEVVHIQKYVYMYTYTCTLYILMCAYMHVYHYVCGRFVMKL